MFKAEGIEVIRTPIAAPKVTAHMERQIGSTRRECLDWMLVLNRRHLSGCWRNGSSTATVLVGTEFLG